MPNLPPSYTHLQISKTNDFTDLIYDEVLSSVNYTNVGQPFGFSEDNTNMPLFFRVKYRHEKYGETAWSPVSQFKIGLDLSPPQIIGICLDNTLPSPVWSYIDENGEKLNSFDKNTHPTFVRSEMVVFDVNRNPTMMTRIPPFYIRTKYKGVLGTFSENKQCWWISNAIPYNRPDIDEWKLHPACNRRKYIETTQGNSIYVGTYMSSKEYLNGTYPICSSKKDAYVSPTAWYGQPTSLYMTEMNTYPSSSLASVCRNDRDLGVEGFYIIDIFDLSAIKLLGLIANLSNPSPSIPTEIISGSLYQTSGSSGAKIILKGTNENPEVFIDDLWGGYAYPIDGLTLIENNGTMILRIPHPRDITLNSVGEDYVAQVELPGPIGGSLSINGYIRDFFDNTFMCWGEEHSLLELFIPRMITADKNSAALADSLLIDRLYYKSKTTVSDVTYLAGGGIAIDSIPDASRDHDRTGLFHFREIYDTDQLISPRIVKY